MPRGRPRKNPLPVSQTAVPENGVVNSTSGIIAMRAEEVKPVPQVPGESEQSSSERLFPDLIPPAPKQEEPKEATPEQEPAKEAEPVKEEPKEEPKPEPEPQSVEALSIEEFFSKNSDSKKKLKIDGEEIEMPLSEIVKNVQLSKHLGNIGREIGEQRRALQEEARKLAELKQPARPNEEPEQTPENSEVKALRQQMEMMQAMLAPTMYQTARQRLDVELKAEGFDDFNEYIPKLDAHVATVKDNNQFNYYNTPEGAKALYFKMKLEDSRKAVQDGAEPKPTPTQEPTAKKEEVAKPPIVKIDAGTTASAGKVDDEAAKYQAALARWKESRSPTDWNAILKYKGLVKEIT